ncbi:DUF1350 family protein [uncultured Thermosynechococcus sp.]|uniref:DUF1350 family protein n=1 Tax=uncultured Thermosynechococcus sp. TaxID=436945 RepID=UPI002630547B|nr:DUF1350 family protein [uncultured Thermosynechococcus sp.]
MEWQEIRGNWLCLPQRPLGWIHFLGGAFVAAAPQVTYRRLLEYLAEAGYGIIATPFVNTFDHGAIALEVLNKLDYALDWLVHRGGYPPALPIYGLGHSMGCKLHLLINSLYDGDRAGNIFLAFNNYAAAQSIPGLDNLPPVGVEFSPTPAETEALIQQRYPVRRNLLIRFQEDDIDQTPRLRRLLRAKFGDMVTALKLPGNHLTPLSQGLRWQVGPEFSPLDAVGQWLQQSLFPEMQVLEACLVEWLNPLGTAPRCRP